MQYVLQQGRTRVADQLTSDSEIILGLLGGPKVTTRSLNVEAGTRMTKTQRATAGFEGGGRSCEL